MKLYPMNEKLVIAVIEGTTRPKRKSIKVAHYIADFGSQLDGVEIVLVDPKDFNFPGDGNDEEGKDPRYSALTARADAFFIVTPEYNHSFPGSLKRLLDSELQNYNHKPVALAGVSSGGWGGVRAIESLVPALRETGLIVLSWDIYFPRVQNLFDDGGQLKAEHQVLYNQDLTKLYAELICLAKILKAAR